MKRYKFVLSIVSHNQNEYVQNLLNSIDEYLVADIHETLIIITHNQTELAEFTSKFNVLHYRNLNARGFGDNHNAAFERVDSELFLIINPDIILIEPVVLGDILARMRDHGIALTSPVTCGFDGQILDYKRKDLTVMNLFKRYIFNFEEAASFEWYVGSFLIVESAAFENVSGFSPKFFMYVEDCALAKKLCMNEYVIGDVTSVKVMHGAQRDSRRSLKAFYLHLKSIAIYFFTGA